MIKLISLSLHFALPACVYVCVRVCVCVCHVEHIGGTYNLQNGSIPSILNTRVSRDHKRS